MGDGSGPPLGIAIPRGEGDASPLDRRFDAVLVALAVGLLSAAVLISWAFSEPRAASTGLRLSGVVATLALLGGGVALWWRNHAAGVRADLAAWPLAFGAVGTGLMAGEFLDAGTSDVAYLIALLTIALGVGGTILTRHGAPAVAALYGLGRLYLYFLEDAGIDDSLDGEVGAAVVVAFFVVLATLLGSFLPGARVVVGVSAAVIGVVGLLALLASLGFAGWWGFSLGEPSRSESSGFDDWTPPDHRAVVLGVLAVAAALVVFWLAYSYITDAPGFRLAAVAMLSSAPPIAMTTLFVDEPTRWALVTCAIGAVFVVAVWLRAPRVAGSAQR